MVTVCLFPLLDCKIPEQEPHLFLLKHAWHTAGVSSYSVTIQRKDGREGEKEGRKEGRGKRKKEKGEGFMPVHSLGHRQCLEQCLAYGGCSISTYPVNEYMSE